MKAMVMAAGLGTRLRPLTDFLPKPMMPVANRPVLHHLLNLLRRHDVREVGINVHAFPEMIEKYFGDGSSLDMSILWSHEPELLGTAGGTKKLQDFWGDETILVTSGDGLHDVDVTALLGHHRRTGALATLTVKPVTDPSAYGVVILDRDTRVRGFQEKPTRDEARSDLANCGVYVIEPELLERIPADTFVDFGNDIWPSLVAANEEIYAYTTMAYWNDVGDLDELRNTILDAVLGHVRIDIPGKEVAPGCWAESGCRIDDSAQLDGPIVLGPNVVIEKDAQVRGPAAIGAECVVGKGAAIRSAALFPGTAVPDEGLAIAGIFGDASKLADALLRYPAGGLGPRSHAFGTIRAPTRAPAIAIPPPGAGMDSFFGLAFDLRALRLLDLVFPRRCAACGSGEELVCRDCRARAPPPRRHPVRAVRRTHRLARRPLPRVRGTTPLVRLGPRRGRLRRALPARSSPAGRSAACGRSRASSPRSSPRSCRARPSTRSPSSPATRSGA